MKLSVEGLVHAPTDVNARSLQTKGNYVYIQYSLSSVQGHHLEAADKLQVDVVGMSTMATYKMGSGDRPLGVPRRRRRSSPAPGL